MLVWILIMILCDQGWLGITIVLSTVTRSQSLDSHETQPAPASAHPLSCSGRGEAWIFARQVYKILRNLSSYFFVICICMINRSHFWCMVKCKTRMNGGIFFSNQREKDGNASAKNVNWYQLFEVACSNNCWKKLSDW